MLGCAIKEIAFLNIFFYNKKKNLPVPVFPNKPLGGAQQMHSHYTNKLLDIEDVIIKNIRHADTFVKIYLTKNTRIPPILFKTVTISAKGV